MTTTNQQPTIVIKTHINYGPNTSEDYIEVYCDLEELKTNLYPIFAFFAVIDSIVVDGKHDSINYFRLTCDMIKDTFEQMIGPSYSASYEPYFPPRQPPDMKQFIDQIIRLMNTCGIENPTFVINGSYEGLPFRPEIQATKDDLLAKVKEVYEIYFKHLVDFLGTMDESERRMCTTQYGATLELANAYYEVKVRYC
jgi:hypothetical protein